MKLTRGLVGDERIVVSGRVGVVGEVGESGEKLETVDRDEATEIGIACRSCINQST